VKEILSGQIVRVPVVLRVFRYRQFQQRKILAPRLRMVRMMVNFQISPFLHFFNTICDKNFVNGMLPLVPVTGMDFVSPVLEVWNTRRLP
jgi:hypothetical protein